MTKRETHATRYTNGQLRPLRKRLTVEQLANRLARRRARVTVAAKLEGQHNLVRGILGAFFGRSFWGRLKWLLTGR